MDATAQAFAGPPETDDRKQDGSQLDVEALLRQAMGDPGFDGRFGVGGATGGRDNALSYTTQPSSDFSVPSAGTTPPPRTSAPAAPMTTAEPQPANPYITPSSSTPRYGQPFTRHVASSNPFDDSDRPTLGQRIAGDVPKPQPAPVQVADSPAFQFDPNKLPDALRPVTMPLPSQVARPPVGQNNQNRLDLMKRQEQLDVPTDPNAIDPKTGKPMFKMGLGQRILGTFANFASGFGGRGGDPVYVGLGATNWKFGQAENLRKENLAGVQSELGNQEKLDQSQEKSYADLVKAAFEGQIAEARKGTATAQQENAETRRQLEASQAEKNAADAELKRTKAGQEPEAKTEPEIALALQMAILKGDKAGVQKYRGALNELSRQKSAGKDTTAADVAKAIQVAEYRGRELDKVDKAQEEERKARYTELDKNVVLRVNLDKRAAAQAAIDQELKTKYAPKAQAVHDAADQMLGLTKAGGVLKSAPSSAHKVPPKVGETILVDGKPRKVVGWNEKTRKPVVAPLGGQ